MKPYRGQSNPKTIEKFIDDVQRISEGVGLNDSQLIILTGRNMTGAADRWYINYKESEENEKDSYKTFENKLKSYFSKGYDEQEPYKKLLCIKHKTSVKMFNSKFRQIIDEIPNHVISREGFFHIYIASLSLIFKEKSNAKSLKIWTKQ